jgi:hypothetical protein
MTNHELDLELERFAQEHPEGWSHDQWMDLLSRLGSTGYDVSDIDGVGLALEHHRLVLILGRMEIKGLGPKRMEAVADRFGTLWNLMNASVDDVAQVPTVSRNLAAQILDVLQ